MTLEQLSAVVDGTVVKPGDDLWDAARRFHSGIGEPAAIVRAATLDDVSAAARYAAGQRLDVMVRGGGHSAWGGVPGGLTIDIGALDEVRIEGDVVHVGGGATWGDVAQTLAAHDLAISSGDTASVGVGGLTLGGGIGLMVRAWGLAADQLVGAQLVTARGAVVEVDDATHPDLMWALRGGGGNFGVVTRFDFRAHRLEAVVAASFGIDGDARPVLATLRELMADAPRELTVTYMDVPPMDPSAPAGASVEAVWAGGDPESARRALAPLLTLPQVTEREFAVRPYPEALLEAPEFDPESPAPGFVGGNTLLGELSDDAIDLLVSFREARPAAVVMARSLGGAFGDVAQGATPFPGRNATWFAMAGAFDIPGLLDDAGRASAEDDWQTIEALGCGVYGNFTTSTEPGFVQLMYPPETRARLAAIKHAWDPTNVFCRNHNIAPAAAA